MHRISAISAFAAALVVSACVPAPAYTPYPSTATTSGTATLATDSAGALDSAARSKVPTRRPGVVPAASLPPGLQPPEPQREFRAAWIATVSNIDWPSRPGLTTEEQKAELVEILDRAAELHLNAVIFQVRAAGDAFYASSIEPWSEYLTGEMGRAPDPFYDPLQFAIEEAHARGLELHAWFNPFRARLSSSYEGIAGSHIARQAPRVVKRYGSQLWMDPGEEIVRQRAIDVITDVVRRYDVDGVHIDDYFYPYRERDRRGRLLEFPDDASWKRYVQFGGQLTRDDWRRANVNKFVKEMYAAVKREKRWVKVGISPFGIWRPGYPSGVTGLDAYRELYADARKWLNEGWLDYIAPQLYWPTEAPQQPYDELLHWWVAENTHNREVWPGNFSSRVGDPVARWRASEILDQIRLTRRDPGAGGNVHFSMRALMENRRGLADSLADGPYARRALIPAMPWLGSAAPPAPAAAVIPYGSTARLELAPAEGATPGHWLVRTFADGIWRTRIIPGERRGVELNTMPQWVVVNAIGRTGIQSASVVLGTEVLSLGTAAAPDGQTPR